MKSGIISKYLSLEKLGNDLREIVVRFPVELVLCVAFTVIGLIFGNNGESELFAKMEFFPICGLVCLAVNFLTSGQRRWPYYLSIVVAIPVLAMNMADYTDSFGYGFGLLLSFLLLFLCRRNAKENAPFSANFVTVISDFVIAGIFVGILLAVIYAVLGSLTYLFDIDDKILSYGFQWPLFLFGPLFFCLRCDSHGQQGFNTTVPPFIRFISKYIVSPAIIIYTVILYAYVARAVITMSLPLGGVAAMVMAYFLVAVGGKMLDEAAGIPTYGWFYKHLHWIVIPILALFWWGLTYRIRTYALTDSRVYLIGAGVVMTVVSVMMAVRTLNRYRLFALQAACVIIILTYIPGISAKSIGIASQKARMERIADSLGLRDAATGKLRESIHLADYDKDQLHELAEAYNYLSREMGKERLEAMAGSLDYNDILYHDNEWSDFFRPYDIQPPLDKYPYLLGNLYGRGGKGRYSVEDNRLMVYRSDKLILDSPIDTVELERAYNTSTGPSDNVFVMSNDSILLVIDAYTRTANSEWTVSYGYECWLFGSRPLEQ